MDIFDNEYRLKYYLGNANKQFNLHRSEAKKFTCGRYHTINRDNLVELYETTVDIEYKYYVTDLLEIYNKLSPSYQRKHVTYFPGDVQSKLKCQSITKCRLKGDKRGTILKLEKNRHFNLNKNMVDYINSIDLPFNNKKNTIVYRGNMGMYKPLINWVYDHSFKKPRRLTLFKKFYKHPLFNIGASSIGSLHGLNSRLLHKYVKPKMSIQQQLGFKYIISVEGVDVASGLKWAMLSNSLVMMPKPTACSWFMEDCLRPYTHYIPLKSNFSDLEKQYEWCENNKLECEFIVHNATQYAKNFYNHRNENILNREVLRRYIDNSK